MRDTRLGCRCCLFLSTLFSQCHGSTCRTWHCNPDCLCAKPGMKQSTSEAALPLCKVCFASLSSMMPTSAIPNMLSSTRGDTQRHPLFAVEALCSPTIEFWVASRFRALAGPRRRGLKDSQAPVLHASAASLEDHLQQPPKWSKSLISTSVGRNVATDLSTGFREDIQLPGGQEAL